MRKFLSMFVCAIMIVSAMMIPISADGNVLWTDGHITLTYNADSATLTVSGQGRISDYDEPVPVFDLNMSPIYGNTDIVHVIIEEGITYIGSCFFLDCANIETVEFPASLTEIGRLAFEGCSKITSVEFPEGIKKLDVVQLGMTETNQNNLTEIKFYGNVPEMSKDTLFWNFHGTVYYPSDNPTWSDPVIESFNGAVNCDITWTAWNAPEITKAENKFTDVTYGAWYIPGIQYVYENNIMSGMGNAKFAPAGKLTREQLMQVFFAMESLDKADYEGETGFNDVPEGRWYSPAVKWAKAEGITNGVKDDVFGLGQYVTREQLATFIMNYVEYKNGDITSDADLTCFSDAGDISDWAVAGIKFCVEKGIINGRANGTLDPRTPANRAELAQILKQYAA